MPIGKQVHVIIFYVERWTHMWRSVTVPINFPLYPYVCSIRIYAILVYVSFVTMICERY